MNQSPKDLVKMQMLQLAGAWGGGERGRTDGTLEAAFLEKLPGVANVAGLRP